MPEWSAQQVAIFDWFRGGAGNLVVRARAGTGKTTTILEGINHAPEVKVLLAAFNKHIATELSAKLRNPRATAKTLHSVGFGQVMRAHSGLRLNEWRGRDIALSIVEAAETGLPEGARKALAAAVARLAGALKGMAPLQSVAKIRPVGLAEQIAAGLGIEPPEGCGWDTKQLAAAALKAVKRAALLVDGCLDFDDMVFLPVALNLTAPTYDMVVVDEAQDMNVCQLILAQRVLRKGGRFVVVGDDRQAIYGFRGADSGSLDRLKAELEAAEMPLTITYRCPRAVVAIARGWVPDYEAAPGAAEGKVSACREDDIPTAAEPGNFVISRVNAPLMSLCLDTIRRGKAACILGRDVGAALRTIVRDVTRGAVVGVAAFREALCAWRRAKLAKINAAEEAGMRRAQMVEDQVDTLLALAEAEEVETTADLTAYVERLFSDDADRRKVVFSTVHKVKGLEAERVFVLRDTLHLYGKVKTIEEDNIAYVATTRARDELVYAANEKKGK